MKFYLILIAVPVFLTSCLKQSIADAMLNAPKKQSQVTATFSYEINGSVMTATVNDADHQPAGNRVLSCEQSNGYFLQCYYFIFNFFTYSLNVGNYKYPSNLGPTFVTNYSGQPIYFYAPTDYMSVNITSYKDGHISGNFSGLLTPGNSNGGYGTASSVVIKNGTFTNVPVY